MPQPSYTLIPNIGLPASTAGILNKQFREHLDEINRLSGVNGPVSISDSLSVGSSAVTAGSINLGAAQISSGTQDPEGQVVAPPGSMYTNTKSGVLWVKSKGQSSTGWQSVGTTPPNSNASAAQVSQVASITFTTTGSTSDSVSLPGVSSASQINVFPRNASAWTDFLAGNVSASPGNNIITLNHSGTSGMVFDLMGTV